MAFYFQLLIRQKIFFSEDHLTIHLKIFIVCAGGNRKEQVRMVMTYSSSRKFLQTSRILMNKRRRARAALRQELVSQFPMNKKKDYIYARIYIFHSSHP